MEIYFSFRALLDAQSAGIIPEGEPIDPMLVVSNSHLSGMFPLFISADAYSLIDHLHGRGVLGGPQPLLISGYSKEDGSASCLAITSSATGSVIYATGAIYLFGFGVPSDEVASEIAVVNLAAQATNFASFGVGATELSAFREVLVSFLMGHTTASLLGTQVQLGFSLVCELRNGRWQWRVGALGDAPEIVI